MTPPVPPREERPCEHDPDDAGDTCCSCGKIMTPEDRHDYEMRLRQRAEEICKEIPESIARDLDAFFKKDSPNG